MNAFGKKNRGRLSHHAKTLMFQAIAEGAKAPELTERFGITRQTAYKYIKEALASPDAKRSPKKADPKAAPAVDHISLRESHLAILDEMGKDEDLDVDTRIRASTAVIRTAPEEAAEAFKPPADPTLRLQLFCDLLEGESPTLRAKLRSAL